MCVSVRQDRCLWLLCGFDGSGHVVWAGVFHRPGSYGSMCHLVEKRFGRRRSVFCRLGRSWGRRGDHVRKDSLGLPGAWHSAVPSWALGEPANWPSVSPSSCTSCPGSLPFSLQSGVWCHQGQSTVRTGM